MLKGKLILYHFVSCEAGWSCLFSSKRGHWWRNLADAFWLPRKWSATFLCVRIYIYTIAKICASNNWCLKHQSIARISSATTATRTTTMINKDTQHVKQHTSKLKQTLRWFNLSDLFLDLSKPVGPARYFLGRLAATNPRQQNTTNIYEYLPEYLWTSEFESEIFRTSNLRWPFELSIEHPYLLGWHWVCNPLRSCWKGWLVHHPITLHRPELSGASQHHLESSGPL